MAVRRRQMSRPGLQLIRWVPALLWCAAIFYATSSPAYTGQHTGQVVGEVLPAASHATTQLVNILMRKVTHFLAFGLLGGLAWWAILPGAGAGNGGAADAGAGGRGPERHPQPATRRVFGAWAFATLYAASDEFHQLFVPGRVGELQDVLLDSVAALIVVALLTAATARRKRPKPSQA